MHIFKPHNNCPSEDGDTHSAPLSLSEKPKSVEERNWVESPAIL